jgi:hypothetical protein
MNAFSAFQWHSLTLLAVGAVLGIWTFGVYVHICICELSLPLAGLLCCVDGHMQGGKVQWGALHRPALSWHLWLRSVRDSLCGPQGGVFRGKEKGQCMSGSLACC